MTHNLEEVYPGNWNYVIAFDGVPDTIEVTKKTEVMSLTIKDVTNRNNPNFTYSFRVQVIVSNTDDTSLSTADNPVLVTASGTGKAPPAPNIPTDITATAGDTSIVVTWARPVGGTTPSGYTVCAIGASTAAGTTFGDLDGNCGDDNQISVTGADTLTATLTADNVGIAENQFYAIGVRADHATADSSAWADLATPSLNPVQVVAVVSDDATLTGLSLSDVTLAETFAAATTSYTASVGNAVATTTVTATPAADATVVITATPNAPTGTDTNEVALNVGANTITVTVTAEDTTTTQAYTVTITREAPSSDATLSDLSLSDVTLTETFAAATTAYTASVGNAVATTTVTANTADDGATVVITATPNAATGTDANVVALDVGANTITVTVTAEDTTTTETYTVTVTREAAALSADATLSDLSLSDVPITFVTATTSYAPDGRRQRHRHHDHGYRNDRPTTTRRSR